MISQIIVVDDDTIILKKAWKTLTDAGFKAVALKSGKALLEYMQDHSAPDLILMDINMPEMSGFDVIKELKNSQISWADTPVIFLTAEEDEEIETQGLLLGAMDFIRKPFVPSVLVLRVKHAIELVALTNNLWSMVAEKTRENESLFLHVVECLADAIDAKDNYTKGHSGRVAAYSKEIARRYGYDEKQQEKIYMLGLLHDVGKIGVPDEVINKPGRLNDEEFACIKKHPAIGYKILSNIKEMPELSLGAKFHHERYDGNGYPEGISGEDIPEVARIIAVADAYDAMTSNRSYRNALPQEKVREEIKKGKGTQFDPQFADIMLEIIDDGMLDDEMLDYIYNESVFFSEHVDLDRLCRFYDEITKTQFLSWENKLFLWHQLSRWSFLTKEYSIPLVMKYNWDLLKEIDMKFKEAFYEENVFDKPEKRIAFSKRNKDLVVIITSQLIAKGHGPTKSALDRAACLQDLGKTVIIFNTAELLTMVGNIPFKNTNVATYCEENLEKTSIEWKGHVIPYVQCEPNMPSIEAVRVLYKTISELKPAFVMEIGNSSLLANCIDDLIPVVFISMGPSLLTPCICSYHTRNRDYTTEEKEILKYVGVDYDRFFPLPFTFSIKEARNIYKKSDLDIAEDVFVSVVVGARLSLDVNKEFLDFLEKFASDKHYIVFLGFWDNYEDVKKERPDLFKYVRYLGNQDDVTGIMRAFDLYINPYRRGGGTSVVEAMAQGLAALAIDYGDVAYNIAPEFLCKDYDEMLDRIKILTTDKDEYNKAREIALKRAEYMLDTKNAMKNLCDMIYERESTSEKD